MKIKNDEDLIKYAKKGNEEAIKIIYDNTYQKSYIIAKSMLKNDEDIADVLQNAYVIAFTKLDQIENPKLYKSWIYKIVNRTCLNEYKKRVDIPFSDIEEKYQVDIEDTNQEFIPDEKTNYEHDKEIIREFINELPFEQKSALIMKYFEELKIKEIAEIFECSENTIKSRINYAKKSLEQKIQTYKQQGNTLFALPLIPFIGWILKEDAKATEIPKLVLNTSSCGFLEQIISKIKEITPQKKLISKAIARKAIITCCSLTAVTGGVIAYKNNQKNKIQTTQPTINENLEQNVTSNDNQINEYIFPNSDKEYLTSEDIESISESMLPFARNEIFARHGRKFADEKYANYFESKNWYKGTIEPEEFDKSYMQNLNEYEKYNINFIQQTENKLNIYTTANKYYHDFLKYYQDFENNNFSFEDAELVNTGLYTLQQNTDEKIILYYTIIDINDDDIPELFISDKTTLYNGYTVASDGQVWPLFGSSLENGIVGERILYNICSNGMIRKFASGGALSNVLSYYYLKPHNFKLEAEISISQDENNYYFADWDGENAYFIDNATESDYEELKNKYAVRTDLIWLKLSEFE
ncbi:sigma-70 family RNA polymerase sigma factor [Massilimicrobiota sp. An80]|uniref:sigma-70 family RNA polymerase sigma factor n=1 Tax=Massilimicrobiota sp. An80 TaxID=1965658 RepID=UPI000B44F9A7|nr:sigma-70 family RNA polymerase sigma factor [Massilimicrobiota sp. An80]OUN30521.1 hypothetical protein B5G32_13095 [Massilimicrobiota sp. An80]